MGDDIDAQVGAVVDDALTAFGVSTLGFSGQLVEIDPTAALAEGGRRESPGAATSTS